MKFFKQKAFMTFAAIMCLGLTGCSGVEREAKYPTGAARDSASGNDIYAKETGIFGSDGISFGKKKKDGSGESGIGVNSFLWRATLDTVSFMPLTSVDPFGGVGRRDPTHSDPASLVPPIHRWVVSRPLCHGAIPATGPAHRTLFRV